MRIFYEKNIFNFITFTLLLTALFTFKLSTTSYDKNGFNKKQ